MQAVEYFRICLQTFCILFYIFNYLGIYDLYIKYGDSNKKVYTLWFSDFWSLKRYSFYYICCQGIFQ